VQNFVFPEPPESPAQPRTALQHATLLDGEMVVDSIPPELGLAAKQERRFLVYDLMLLNGQSLVQVSRLSASSFWNSSSFLSKGFQGFRVLV
jgi:hypothetical protein